MPVTSGARRGFLRAFGWTALALSAGIAIAACSGGSAPVATLPQASSATPLPSSAGVPSSAVPSPAVPSPAVPASLRPLTRDQAISIARPLAIGGASLPRVQAAAGPFGQFVPTLNAKVPQPPADHWVWQVTFSDGQATTSFVILDYDTGQLIESGVATP